MATSNPDNKSNSNQNYNKGPSIAEIMEKIDIPAFANQHLPAPVKKQSKNWYYDCPFCGEGGKKALSFTPAKGLWRCNNEQCGQKGNLFSYLEKVMGMSKADVVNLLKEAAGIPVDPPGEKGKPGRKPGNKKGQGGQDNFENRRKDPLPIAPPSSAKIYSRFVDLTHLTDAHRQEMKKKRGFTDKTIDDLKFRSGGEYVAGVLTQLKEEFSADELALSGVMVKQNNSLIPSEQLLQDRILIPYMDAQGEVYHLRPHKLGFKDVAPLLYHKYFLREKPESIIFTEGEFKAVALSTEWGIPAIATPGTPTLITKYFDRLIESFKEAETKQIIVIFDNEEKGDPSIPDKFKERVEDRYDVLYYAYINAYKLAKAGFSVNIGQLPTEWREGGKIDFDMALAQGRTREDIEKIIQTAVPPNEFVNSLPEEAQRIVRKKIAKYFARLDIRREFNKYVIVRHAKGSNPYEETISNFVINIKSNLYGSEGGVVRYIQLVNEFGEISDTFPLSPADMASTDSFRKYCFGKGNYLFEGRADDLIKIWKFEFNRDSGEMIYMPEKIGRVFDNLWLFGNLAIRDKEIFRPNDDGIIWIDGRGYKPQSIEQAPTDTNEKRGGGGLIPVLHENQIDVLDIIEKMKHSIGYAAYIGVGWVIATIFSDDIFKVYKCSPFLYCHGKKESGKTTFMRWVMRFMGIETNGINLPESSQNSIMRSLAYYCSLGVWYDEYRNDKDVTKKDGYFRSAYNRQSTGKGIKSGFGVKTYSVNASIAIVGEETPKDIGLFSRCAIIQFSSFKRDGTWKSWLDQESYKFSYLTYYLIMNYDKYKDKILKSIEDMRNALVQEEDITERIAENWAIIAGSFEAVIKEDQGFLGWVVEMCKDLKQANMDEEMLSQFWDDIAVLYSKGEIGKDEVLIKDDILYLWFSGLYNAWAVYFKKKNGREPFDRNTIIKYLRDEPYFVKGTTSMRINGVKKRVVAISIEKAGGAILELCEMAERNGDAMPDANI